MEILENSGLCCAVYGVNIPPLGYADDIASASTNKHNTDQVLNLVYNHSKKWRYMFNPHKSAILVYGESEIEGRNNAMYRTYKLGRSHIKEQTEYDHLGLKNITKSSYTARTIEKVKKGRRTLNAAAGLGLKPGGLSMHACSILFWAMIIPIVTFASELWILSDEDIVIIEGFQRYAGRRIQRFHSRSPNETSYADPNRIIHICKKVAIHKDHCYAKRWVYI